ncbi:MAG: homoaconitate hydratase [Promethearchaeota archaeon]|nr:MAG: homoaconitate hydratase [Candidatus Lokiarchaeota archaeon]
MPKLKMDKFLKKLPPDYAEFFEKGWIHNYTIEYHIENGTKFPSKVIIGDQTLRDGEQQTGVIFNPEEKVEIAKLFSEMGITTVEIGFPAVSEEEVKACKMIHAENLKFLPFVMCRAKASDIDKALEADSKAIDLFTSSSEFHIRSKLKMTPEENIENYCKAAEYARDHGLTIIMGREDCSRSHLPYLAQLIVAAKEAGGNKWAGFGISDTTGSLTPATTIWLFQKIVKEIVDAGYGMEPAPGFHCHNDLGLATANTLAAVEAGAQGVSGTFTGIGERAGNAPLEEVIMALETLYGIDTKINLEKMVECCELISKYAGVPIPVNKPIIGANVFKHEAGIHAAGVLAHPYTYETIPHAWLGKKSIFRYGKFSGTDVILKDALKDSDLPEPNRQQLLEITFAVKNAQITKGIQIFRNFVDTYQNTMSQMGMSQQEVIEIARQVLKK